MAKIISNLKNPADIDADQSRRGFFKRCSAALAVLAYWPTAKAETTKSTQANLRASSKYYPTPSYLPDGYVQAGIYLDRPDGFSGGPTEVTLWYKNPAHPQGFANPIGIYMSPAPQRQFFTTEKHEAKIVELQMLSGEKVEAQYHDGTWMWEPDGSVNGHLQWNSSNAHALVFQLRGLTVGIRASRLTGVSYDNLLRVAASLK